MPRCHQAPKTLRIEYIWCKRKWFSSMTVNRFHDLYIDKVYLWKKLSNTVGTFCTATFLFWKIKISFYYSSYCERMSDSRPKSKNKQTDKNTKPGGTAGL